jgi:hypothetical protein
MTSVGYGDGMEEIGMLISYCYTTVERGKRLKNSRKLK